MTEADNVVEMRKLEMKLSLKYLRLFSIFLIITVLLIILIVLSAIGIIFLGLGTNWILISFEDWMVGLSVLLGIFILLEIILFIHYSLVRRKRLKIEKPTDEFIEGKKVYDITVPKDTDGGVYSKTYIEIDNYGILRLKYLMIPPEEL